MHILLAISALCSFVLVWAWGVAIARRIHIGHKGGQAPVPSQGDFAQHLFAAIEDGSMAYSSNGSGDLSDTSQPKRLRASFSAEATSPKRS
jgi:hypothetical protein